MKFIPIKTTVLQPPKHDMMKLLDKITNIQEGDIICISSKIVAIHQGQCIKKETINKHELIKKESDKVIHSCELNGKTFLLTLKNGIPIPSAGIDESNGNGYYILRPKNIQQTCQDIYLFFKKKYGLNNFGVIMIDSNIQIGRRGTVGNTIGFYGIKPTKDYTGTKDIFGENIFVTKKSIVDPLASMANFYMGESDEITPIVLIKDVEGVEYSDKDEYKDFIIPREFDIYGGFL